MMARPANYQGTDSVHMQPLMATGLFCAAALRPHLAHAREFNRMLRNGGVGA